MNNNPIGIFDSGLGGLTVAKELMSCLPHENIVYFGDTARVPYGTKSRSSIVRFSQENAAVLLKYKVKMIVVACNSSSSYAINALKKQVKVPVVGVIEAGVRGAAKHVNNKRIGVIATSATINSESYVKAIARSIKGAKVFTAACPLFVPLVEEGWVNNTVTKEVAKQYLRVLKTKKINSLILGCTHYPLLKPVLSQVMGESVSLIDSAKEVALVVRDTLNHYELLARRKVKGKPRILVSDRPQHFEVLAKRFLGKRFLDVRRIGYV